MATLAEIIEIKYGYSDGFEVADIGAGPYIDAWNLPHPEPTVEELQAWAADSVDLILEPIRQSLRTQAEDTFYQMASEKTGEPINALIIQEWQAKEILVKQWVAASRPAPADNNEYALAYYEAAGDPDKTPSELMETWLTNATNWRMLNTAYIAWRQSFRARLKVATTEAELEALRASIEPELRGLLGLS